MNLNADLNSGAPSGLVFPRPRDGGVELREEVLGLPDGYQTPVLHHVGAGGGGGPPVLYAHGIQSHPGWYVGSADALAAAGHDVFQVTRRGSGTNTAGRGDAPSAGRLLDDVEAALEWLCARTGADAAALLGVSWGGKLLTAFALDRPRRVASLTLVAPGLCQRVDVSAGTKLAIAASLLCCPRRRFDIPLSDVRLFTDRPDMQDYLRNDPHRLQRATARLMLASRRLDRRLTRAPDGSLRVPTTLILAERDRIIDSKATAALVRRLTAGRARVRTFDAEHSIEFVPDPAGFFAALVGAAEATGPAPGGPQDEAGSCG